MNKNYLESALVTVLVLLTGYNTYTLHSVKKELGERAVAITDQLNTVKVNTDGKLQDLGRQYEKLAAIGSTTVRTKEVVYAAKESKEDADIELKSSSPAVTVRVNGGQKYSFDLLETETGKFQGGKLVINSTSTAGIDITTSEYKRTKWELTTAMNSDKNVLGGISYRLGHSVSANVFAGQGIKPYYGFTWSIGSHTRKDSSR